MRLGSVAVAAMLVAACGGKQPAPQPTPTLDDGSGSAVTPDATTAEGSAAMPPFAGAPKCDLEQAGVANVDCALQWLAGFASTMCACTTQTCVTAVGHDMERWQSELPASVQAAPGTPEQNAKGAELGKQMGACIAKIAPAPEPGATGSD